MVYEYSHVPHSDYRNVVHVHTHVSLGTIIGMWYMCILMYPLGRLSECGTCAYSYIPWDDYRNVVHVHTHVSLGTIIGMWYMCILIYPLGLED